MTGNKQTILQLLVSDVLNQSRTLPKDDINLLVVCAGKRPDELPEDFSLDHKFGNQRVCFHHLQDVLSPTAPLGTAYLPAQLKLLSVTMDALIVVVNHDSPGLAPEGCLAWFTFGYWLGRAGLKRGSATFNPKEPADFLKVDWSGKKKGSPAAANLPPILSNLTPQRSFAHSASEFKQAIKTYIGDWKPGAGSKRRLPPRVTAPDVKRIQELIPAVSNHDPAHLTVLGYGGASYHSDFVFGALRLVGQFASMSSDLGAWSRLLHQLSEIRFHGKVLEQKLLELLDGPKHPVVQLMPSRTCFEIDGTLLKLKHLLGEAKKTTEKLKSAQERRSLLCRTALEEIDGALDEFKLAIDPAIAVMDRLTGEPVFVPKEIRRLSSQFQAIDEVAVLSTTLGRKLTDYCEKLNSDLDRDRVQNTSQACVRKLLTELEASVSA